MSLTKPVCPICQQKAISLLRILKKMRRTDTLIYKQFQEEYLEQKSITLYTGTRS